VSFGTPNSRFFASGKPIIDAFDRLLPVEKRFSDWAMSVVFSINKVRLPIDIDARTSAWQGLEPSFDTALMDKAYLKISSQSSHLQAHERRPRQCDRAIRAIFRRGQSSNGSENAENQPVRDGSASSG
jgi:hypothetical protein